MVMVAAQICFINHPIIKTNFLTPEASVDIALFHVIYILSRSFARREANVFTITAMCARLSDDERAVVAFTLFTPIDFDSCHFICTCGYSYRIYTQTQFLRNHNFGSDLSCGTSVETKVSDIT